MKIDGGGDEEKPRLHPIYDRPWVRPEEPMNCVVIVGEAPSRQNRSGEAFLGPSGAFIRKLMRLPDDQPLTEWFNLCNLLTEWQPNLGKGSGFDEALAKTSAKGMLNTDPHPWWILCGRRVAKAFGISKTQPYFHWFWWPDGQREREVAIIPHPSGVNRKWNDPRVRNMGEGFLRHAAWIGKEEYLEGSQGD